MLYFINVAFSKDRNGNAIPESVNNPDGYGGERRLVHDRTEGVAQGIPL